VKTKSFIADIAREWDTSRDGSVSKMEFRQNIRKLLEDKNADAKEMDRLFDQLDADRSGSLEVSEIKDALKKLHEAAANATVRAANEGAQASELRARAQRASKVAEAIVSSEEKAAELKEAESRLEQSVGVQLGTKLSNKGAKVGEIVAKWGGGDGSIDKTEFSTQVRALGVVCTDEELEELFDSIDDDGGGTLDVPEVRRALKSFAEESDQLKAVVKAVRQKSADLTKLARELQSEWRVVVAREEAEEVAEREREAREAEAKAAAAAELKAARVAALAEKKAAEAAEKAAFDAKIKARRQATKELADEALTLMA